MTMALTGDADQRPLHITLSLLGRRQWRGFAMTIALAVDTDQRSPPLPSPC